MGVTIPLSLCNTNNYLLRDYALSKIMYSEWSVSFFLPFFSWLI